MARQKSFHIGQICVPVLQPQPNWGFSRVRNHSRLTHHRSLLQFSSLCLPAPTGQQSSRRSKEYQRILKPPTKVHMQFKKFNYIIVIVIYLSKKCDFSSQAASSFPGSTCSSQPHVALIQHAAVAHQEADLKAGCIDLLSLLAHLNYSKIM